MNDSLAQIREDRKKDKEKQREEEELLNSLTPAGVRVSQEINTQNLKVGRKGNRNKNMMNGGGKSSKLNV